MNIKNIIKDRAKTVMLNSRGTDAKSVLAILKSDLKDVFNDYLDVEFLEIALEEGAAGGIEINVSVKGNNLKNVGRVVK